MFTAGTLVTSVGELFCCISHMYTKDHFNILTRTARINVCRFILVSYFCPLYVYMITIWFLWKIFAIGLGCFQHLGENKIFVKMYLNQIISIKFYQWTVLKVIRDTSKAGTYLFTASDFYNICAILQRLFWTFSYAQTLIFTEHG